MSQGNLVTEECVVCGTMLVDFIGVSIFERNVSDTCNLPLPRIEQQDKLLAVTKAYNLSRDLYIYTPPNDVPPSTKSSSIANILVISTDITPAVFTIISAINPTASTIIIRFAYLAMLFICLLTCTTSSRGQPKNKLDAQII